MSETQRVLVVQISMLMQQIQRWSLKMLHRPWQVELLNRTRLRLGQMHYLYRKTSKHKLPDVDAKTETGVQVRWTREAAWPSGQHVRLAVQRSQVRVPLWPLAGFVLGHPEFKSSATLVNSQLHGCLLPLGVLNPVMLYLNICFS